MIYPLGSYILYRKSIEHEKGKDFSPTYFNEKPSITLILVRAFDSSPRISRDSPRGKLKLRI